MKKQLLLLSLLFMGICFCKEPTQKIFLNKENNPPLNEVLKKIIAGGYADDLKTILENDKNNKELNEAAINSVKFARARIGLMCTALPKSDQCERSQKCYEHLINYINNNYEGKTIIAEMLANEINDALSSCGKTEKSYLAPDDLKNMIERKPDNNE